MSVLQISGLILQESMLYRTRYFNRDDSFSTYVKFSEKLTFLT